MKELIEKLKKEHTALLEKMEKLERFIEDPEEAAKKAGAVQVYLLQTQLKAMELYLHTLEARIEDLEDNAALEERTKTETTEKEADKPKEKEEDKPEEDIVKGFIDALSEVLGKDFKVEVHHFSSL